MYLVISNDCSHVNDMNIDPTIPCPVCKAPIYVRYMTTSGGDIARVYAEPLLSSEEVVNFHEHQMGDIELRILN
jgi:hypothetical protein